MARHPHRLSERGQSQRVCGALQPEELSTANHPLPHLAAGLVAVYSLKNPGHPEFSFSTAAGVMCLDFHPEHPALLAVGCYDGHIAIFDVRMGECLTAGAVLGWLMQQAGQLGLLLGWRWAAAFVVLVAAQPAMHPAPCPPPASPAAAATAAMPALPAGGGEPLYRSTPRSGKHADPVWQVAWQRTAGHELQLASISTDGRVTLWTVSRNELMHQALMELCSLRGRDDSPSGSTAEPADSSRPATGASSGSGSGRAAGQDVGGEAAAGIAGAEGDAMWC